MVHPTIAHHTMVYPTIVHPTMVQPPWYIPPRYNQHGTSHHGTTSMVHPTMVHPAMVHSTMVHPTMVHPTVVQPPWYNSPWYIPPWYNHLGTSDHGTTSMVKENSWYSDYWENVFASQKLNLVIYSCKSKGKTIPRILIITPKQTEIFITSQKKTLIMIYLEVTF